MSQTARPNAPVRIRPIALPAEHGGWSFLFEPILLGLLVAPSVAGACFGVGMIFAFLARHPLKLALSDRQRGKRLARTPIAERFTLIYGAVSLAGFGLALLIGSIDVIAPLLIAAPLLALQAYFDASRRSRDLAAELSGSVALAVAAVSIAIAGGWSAAQAYPLWIILAARGLPAILYVRARLRLERGQVIDHWLPLIAHVAALVVGIVLVAMSITPALSAVALGLLLARAIYGLSPYRRGHAAKQVGVQEVIAGMAFIALVVVGYAANSGL